SYNIHHANPPSQPNVIDMAAIANVIKNQSPHLVAIQEVDVNTTRSGVNLNQAEELARITGMRVYFGKAIDYAGGQYGVAILSKFPITDASNNPLPTAEGTGGERRTLAKGLITLGNGKKVVFASTHLDAQASDTNRYLQVNRIIEILRNEQHPVIVAGDFNAVPCSRVINTLDSYFTRSCITNCGFTIPVNNPNKTIDFIAFAPSEKFTVLEHKVIDEKYASDHLPVVSVIRIK
ncbi:MAG TPA: endonuclease/exonuclease/phosphatase family protein, partial [Flavisolibacter sp.]|nr:endonuclease/exonuclease/phosphatase family protein [Flavisolibacter sp.]